MISKLASKQRISRYQQVTVAEQAGSSMTCSEIRKTDFSHEEAQLLSYLRIESYFLAFH